ncbi:hypothetical protein CCR95_05510 [Thiocystis minor]|nr:hypothetical protein [Thiocystis minor]
MNPTKIVGFWTCPQVYEISGLGQLERISTKDDRLRSLLCRFETFVTWPTARWLHLAAQRFSAIGEPVDAKEYWEALLALPEGARPDCRNSLQSLDASRNLALLFAADGPFPDPKRHGVLIVQVLQQQPELAAEIIIPDVAAWSIECVCHILVVTPDVCHEDILSVWFRTAQIDIESIFSDLETVLTEHSGLQQRPAIKFRLVSHLLNALRKYRHALLTRNSMIEGARIRQWLEHWTSVDWYSSSASLPEKISLIIRGLMESAYHADACVLGCLTNQVKGGFKVDLGGVAAFLPVSEANRLRIASTNPDQGFEFKILDVPTNPNKDMVLSRRLLAEQRFDQLTKGQVIEGIVTTVVDYGVFVDLGGIVGLLHKSRMGNQGLLTPSDLLQEGQKVLVEIIGINRDTRNVALKLT